MNTIYYDGSDGQVHSLGDPNFIEHHGVLGMKWGVRRYQPYPKGHSGGKEVGSAKQKSYRGERKYDKITSKINAEERRARNITDKKKLAKSNSKINKLEKKAQRAMDEWGSQERKAIEKATNKKAKEYTKQLRKLDEKATSSYVTAYGHDNAKRILEERARIADSKGKTEKAVNFTERAKAVGQHRDAYRKESIKAYKELNKLTNQILKSDDLVVNIRKDNYYQYSKGSKVSKDVIDKYGKLKMTDRQVAYYYNAGLGNNYKVYRKSDKNRYSTGKLNAPIPVRVDTYYY